jgi:hypothetical protein
MADLDYKNCGRPQTATEQPEKETKRNKSKNNL